MKQLKFRLALGAALVAGAALLAQTTLQLHSPKTGEWIYWSGDLTGSRYSPLDQINAGNFNKLEVAWRFKTDNFGTRPEYKLEGTPLMVNGVIYTTAGTRRDAVALDAATGEIRWVYSMKEGQRAVISPRQLSGHGVSYWTDGKGDERILFITTGYRLVELNAKTGDPIPSFGQNGVVDLKIGLITGAGKQIDPETGEAGLHSTALIVRNNVIVGVSMKEGHTPVTHDNTKGAVRAYDVHTGKMVWMFNTVPRPGEFGNDTWENGSWATNGNTGVWSQMAADEEHDLVYAPVEDPTSDYYGGHRPGNNLYGDSIVCINATTGKRVWHYQVIHHPIWNYDSSSQPIVADITVDGKNIPAVALPGKQAFLYVFNRLTGEPVWPIVEKPVQQSDVPGEKTSPTQPFPTKPPAYSRNVLHVPDDLIDFTPELRAEAKDIIARYRVAGMYNPALIGDPKGLLGSINIGNGGGGTNWNSAGYDPETHIVYAQAENSGISGFSVRTSPPGFSDMRYLGGREDQPFVDAEGAGANTAADVSAAKAAASNRAPGGNNALTVHGLPIMKPPYAVISAINLDRGDIQWQVPFGETPDNIRNSPLLKGLNIGNTGQRGECSVLVTKTLLIIGDALVTSGTHPRGAMLRAYDKATGKELGAVWMPGPQSGGPMTYMWQGKQYIVVAISGGNYSGEYLAFALPDAE
ncbi:MAG: PQQ-binding-like beta-propeller repeat protein [Bryobacteraceae bacterium]|jgi:quinoprotein glucose dehydrogenase